MTQVFDTGDELEIEIALLYPSVFNANARGKDEFPEDSKDGRSDNSVIIVISCFTIVYVLS